VTVTNIYVGNLSFRTGEEELEAAFSSFGTVDKVTILKDKETGRSRGFGFVEMSNKEEADRAIMSMNGRELGGRALQVNEARPRESGGGGGGRGGYGGDRRGGGGGYGGDRRRY
jgi:RNA recognition motif-containing protein